MLTPDDRTALRAWCEANDGTIPRLVLRLLEERAPAAPGPILPPARVAEVLARRTAIKRTGPVLIETREDDDSADFTYILYTGDGDIAHVAEGAIPERFIRYAKKTAVFLAATFDDIPALCASHEALREREDLAVQAAREEEWARWQSALDEIPEVAEVDGAGSDGDELDFTVACVRGAIARLHDAKDEAANRIDAQAQRIEALEAGLRDLLEGLAASPHPSFRVSQAAGSLRALLAPPQEVGS